MTSKSFYEWAEVVAQEKNLSLEDVMSKVATALKKACALEGFNGDVQIEFNYEKKEIKIVEYKYVVAEVDPEGPVGQITLEEAKQIKERVKVGSTIKTRINIEKEIGRKGASQFKQVFSQGLKELGRKRSYEFFKEHENEMITARVNKVLEDAYILGIGLDYDAYMPKKEALPTENLVVGENVKVYITKVEETGKGPKVFVSRTNVGIVKRLFENAVPEVADGTIEIVAMARDAGNRTKIGVRSTNPNVEAKGACVGLQGIRIKQINDALNGERIDIFVWNDDPVQLIAQAISPAKVLSVLVYPDLRQALVIVPDMQYSLAIGKGGQNARLASQVTGWKIDIKDESTAYREKIKFKINVL